MKLKLLIIIFLITITNVTALNIYTHEEFEAGKEYTIEIHTNAKQVEGYIEIIDSDGSIILKKTNATKITEGAFSQKILVPSNEESQIYIIHATITDGVNEFKNQKPVSVITLTWYEKLLRVIFENVFGFRF